MKDIKMYVISYLSSLASSILGMLWSATILAQPALVGILIFVSFLPLLLFFANIYCKNKYVKNINQTQISEMQTQLLKHRENAESTAVTKLKTLKHIRSTILLYTLFLGLCAGLIAIFAGTLYSYQKSLFAILLILSAIVFYAVYTRIRRQQFTPTDSAPTVIYEKDYPQIYRLARKAAEKVHCPGDIQIQLSEDYNIGISKDGKRNLLYLSAILLNIMSEEEIYHIFLHEFSHVSHENAEFINEKDYSTWMITKGEDKSKFFAVVSNLFLFPEAVYCFHHLTLEYATSVLLELRADQAMAKYGCADIAASALLKLHYSSMYDWELGVKNEHSIYESETLEANYLYNQIKALQEAIEKRSADWNKLAGNEILANNASHPTLKMRFESLGIQQIKLAVSESSAEFASECQKALKHIESLIYQSRTESYREERNKNYLTPQERISKWKASGMPISAENYADIVDDLRLIGQNEEAEALCDRALEELSENSSLYAAYMKGCSLLHRYDESGIAYIYRAIEKNANFLEEGLYMIGQFCCYTGREKELLEYRQRAVLLAQKNKDENSQAGYLSKHDHLTRETLPDGMLDNILAFIHSVDENIIQNIYLVRKTVSDTFFTSVFIIHFYGGTNAQRNEIMHKIFSFLDSYPVEWQFSLFDYFQYPQIKVEKIEGSLVYSKSNKVN